MNIHNKLQTSVPFSSIKQGDLFWSYGVPRGLFIKLCGDYDAPSHYAYNSYKVGAEKGGHNFCDDELVSPVNDVTVS